MTSNPDLNAVAYGVRANVRACAGLFGRKAEADWLIYIEIQTQKSA